MGCTRWGLSDVLPSVETVRYRPGEALRWLATGADNIRKAAGERGRSVIRQTGTDQKKLTENLRTAAGALVDMGRSAYAEVLHRQAEAMEYVLLDDRLDLVKGGKIESIAWDTIKGVRLDGDRAQLVLAKGHVTIKPFAHLVAGRVKVPVGWTRNGMEVPYELLIEEIAARARCEIDED